MSRGHGGRNTARPATLDQADADAIGMSDRVAGTPSPIPGGETHLTNHQTMRQSVPVPAPKPEHRGVMAHGVPPDQHTTHERAEAMRGPNSIHDRAPAPERHRKAGPPPVAPVPVTIVQAGSDIDALRTDTPRRVQVPGFGTGDPIRLCGRNAHRDNLLLLNEDATHHVRFAKSLSELNLQSSGAVLPATTSSYLRLRTQDELWAIGDSTSAVYVSIIEEFDRAGEVS